MNGQEQDRRMKAIEEMERELAEPLGHFRGAVTVLADRAMTHAARMARPAEKRSAWRTGWVYSWAPAGLVVVLLAVGLTLSDHDHARQPVANQASVATVGQAPQQVSDNALLTEIDQDLNQNAPTPLVPLEVSTTSTTQASSTQMEDSYSVEP